MESNQMKINITRSLSIVAIFIMISCGFYSFQGNIPSHLKTLYLDVFQNRSVEFQIETRIYDQFYERLTREGLLNLVTVKKEADSYIEGEIQSIKDNPFTFDENENILEYKLEITCSITWYDAKLDKELFKKTIKSSIAYYSETENSNLASTDQKTRETAMEEALELLTDNLIAAMTEDW
jgi:outer membrane lipopolysaccharide assembly protein LptE/RlpB